MLNRLSAGIKLRLNYVINFGLSLAIAEFIIVRYCSRNKLLNKFRHLALQHWFDKQYSNIIEKYKNKEFDTNSLNNGPVFVFWWQGEQAMPVLVKNCYSSIRKNLKTYNVILITKNNYQHYCKIPEYCLSRLEKGEISITHFSDILRVCLIFENGGLWIDATVFVSQEPSEGILKRSFFTLKGNDDKGISSNVFVSDTRWTSYLQGGIKNNNFHGLLREILFAYLEKFDTLITYLFIDYFMDVGYRYNIGGFKDYITSLKPIGRDNIYALDICLMQGADQHEIAEVLKNNTFFKLSNRKIYLADLEEVVNNMVQ